MKDRFLMTASLLDKWKYLLNNEYSKLDEFLKVLRREPSETTEVQKQGYEFEAWAKQNYADTLNGAYQVKAYKDLIAPTGTAYLLYGVIDCIKSGKIYDFKHTKQYDVGKFFDKAQTSMYLELIPEAKDMTYIISVDPPKYLETQDKYLIYTETYTRAETPQIKDIICDFELWLKSMDLWEIYKQNWRTK